MKVRSKERFTAEQWFSHEKPVTGVRRVASCNWRNECPFCDGNQEAHGQVETREHTRVICSGDWVVTTVVTGAQEVLNSFRFHERFESIEDDALLDRILEIQRRINAEHIEEEEIDLENETCGICNGSHGKCACNKLRLR